MNSIRKTIALILILGIFFAFLSIFATDLNFKSTEFNESINLDDKNLKISAVSGKIHIINNSGWEDFRSDGNCTGLGTYSNPYVIEDLVIDGSGSGGCILIENSTVYFIIENCTLYSSAVEWEWDDVGIELSNVNNSQLIDNNCSSNYVGIRLLNSSSNSISRNKLENNDIEGIYLDVCHYNNITGNDLSNNDDGISLGDSNYNSILNNTSSIGLGSSCYNTISGNTASNSDGVGIRLGEGCDNNVVSENTANNNTVVGIYLEVCNNNTISGNTANNNIVGIYIYAGYYNDIMGNTANYNEDYGISLFGSDNNTIEGNTANYNHNGISLFGSDNNTISGNNLIGNDECIVEENCEGNVFENNNCGGRFPFEIFILVSVISGGAVVGVALFLIMRKRK